MYKEKEKYIKRETHRGKKHGKKETHKERNMCGKRYLKICIKKREPLKKRDAYREETWKERNT